jgi:ABC-type multidrug transport system permease subunit
MRWLMLKDLQILRRSPLLVSLLVIYPIAISLLIGFALSRGPAHPRVAFLNEVPPSANTISLGSDKIDISKYSQQLFSSIQPIRVQTRQQALDRVRSGDALAALIIPPDITERLASGVESAQVEVIYNGDALKQSFVESTINAKLAEANAALAQKLDKVAAQDVDLLLNGGNFQLLTTSVQILGLKATKAIIAAAAAGLPPGSASRAGLDRVANFASLAVDNLDLGKQALATLSQPITVKRTLLRGRRTPLDAFAVATAVTVSLMFLCVLLAAGVLALEREENAFSRLVRGLVSRETLLIEKILLSAGASFLVTLAMLLGLGAFVGLDWGRFPQWLAALAVGAIAFAALGVAIGSLAREVRAASLLAFLLALPLAFLALVPSGAVATGLYDVIRVISAVFPFKPALQAMDAALNGADPGLGPPLLHLAALTAAFGVLARVGLRRF